MPGIRSNASSSEIIPRSSRRAEATMRLSNKLRPYFCSISHCLATSWESIVDDSVAPLIWRALRKAKIAFLIFAGSLPMLLRTIWNSMIAVSGVWRRSPFSRSRLSSSNANL